MIFVLFESFVVKSIFPKFLTQRPELVLSPSATLRINSVEGRLRGEFSSGSIFARASPGNDAIRKLTDLRRGELNHIADFQKKIR